ncbi:hypothetical protein [Vreelandella utahensis]|uniref:hypothetical protein n=1 Tax=Vreelandella halophila TaxID=86177 RepID=UPI001C4DE627|nr:hypothetical protein [Halomonas utahensis]
MERARVIAGLMAEACHELHSAWAPACRLRTRVGSGRATWHRYDPRRDDHCITIGALMVADKAQPALCGGWLSMREIQGRGYFGGTVSELNLLAHGCCHEFAHLLQTRAGGRRYGQVHNAVFYQWLDRLHQSGSATTLRSRLAEAAAAEGLPLATTPVTPAAETEALTRFSPGDRVAFGQGLQGRIRRVNRRTCTVDGTGPCRGRRYRVPPRMMTPIRETEPV